MKVGKVELYIHEILESKGAMIFSLIDPDDYPSADLAAKTAKSAAEGGADLMVLGGSTGAQGELLERVTREIKEKTENIPVALFPGNIATLTKYADAVYFMSLLNARNPYWITQAQMLAAPLVKQMGIEPLPVGYIVIEPGGTVGWVGDVNMVPRAKPRIAAALANAGEFLGNRLIFTDAGSNPQLQHFGPIPPEIIKAVRKAITVPYIVGGGIKNPSLLRTAYISGADIGQIGTALEDSHSIRKTVEAFAKVTKEEGAKKR